MSRECSCVAIERRAFTAGYKEGVRAHSIWKDGAQVVGSQRQPLADAIYNIESGRSPYFNDVLAVWERERR